MNLLPTATAASTTTATGAETGIETECGNCGSNNKWVLHYVRLRGIHRRLCTSCVLRLHPSSFCPTCFAFYDAAPPHPSKRLSCSSCSSFTHSHCAPSSSSPYLCPPCKDPAFSFFDVSNNINRTDTAIANNINNSSGGSSDGARFIDKKLANALFCAVKIASASMGKAEIVARAEAERRVREAALARKRARESLEHVALLAGKENMGRPREGSAEVSGSAHLNVKPKEGFDRLVMGPNAVPRLPPKSDNGTAKGTTDKSANYHHSDGQQVLQITYVKQEDASSK